MKITHNDYNTIKTAISWLSVNTIKSIYFAAMDNPKAKDVNKLYRWNLSYTAKLSPFFCDIIYEYADDSHIDTALKQAIKELEIANFEKEAAHV